ncbi:PspA/IM30 family protein [Desulfohalovibrio reitneri]|uniref:PspA/IM30 family protein n=1 Tax=Desulfohalovibrio reitneri TaxID=1307759 RepID=UPI0004A76B84|nr:PspA/IM30 family protein [Desulfohalovibrio reitneri]
MGIFSRFKDIVSANISHMLDRAEDPEKMIRLMIREMEETLVEIKANTAKAMADRATLARRVEELSGRAATWAERARLAVAKGRDDLAREALAEKKRLNQRLEAVREELDEADALVAQAQEDIAQLEDKLRTAREKRRSLGQRHKRATDRSRCRREMRKADSSRAAERFERYQQNIERMEADAEMAAPPAGTDLEDAFRELEDSDVEEELTRLKDEVSQQG